MLGVLSFILLYLIDVSISFVTLTTLNMTKLASNVILSEVEESRWSTLCIVVFVSH